MGPQVLGYYMDWLKRGGKMCPSFYLQGSRQIRSRLIGRGDRRTRDRVDQ